MHYPLHMTKLEKLLDRLLTKPRDFTWDELKSFKWLWVSANKRWQNWWITSKVCAYSLSAHYFTQTTSKAYLKTLSARRYY